jgi:hypothetical protein
MSLMDVNCKICGNDFKMDIGDHTMEEVTAMLKKRDSFHCNAGNHMEIGSPINHWTFGKIHDGSAPTEEEWYDKMTAQYGKLIGTDELREKFEVTGFAFGSCMAKVKATGKEICLDFIHSPKGVRYYYGYFEYKED